MSVLVYTRAFVPAPHLSTPKLGFFLILAFLLGGLLAGIALIEQFRAAHDEHTRLMAEETAAIFTVALVDDVIADDTLSLTVVLRDAVNRGVIASASVYDNAGELVATAGAPERDLQVVSRELVAQNTVVGRLQITLSAQRAPGYHWLWLPALLGLLSAFGFWRLQPRYGHLLENALKPDAPLPAEAQPDEQQTSETEPPVLHEQVTLFPSDPVTVMLVIKVEPARRATEAEAFIRAIAASYAGKIERQGNEFCLITHDVRDAVTAAISLEDAPTRNLSFKSGIHCERSASADLHNVKNRARYLASLSRGQLLGSQGLVDELNPGDFTVLPFHSSFAQADIYEVA